MDYIKTVIESAFAAGVAFAQEQLGLTSGEISQRKARDTYGKWFADAAAKGRIRPSRVEDGRTGTRWYRVTDILQLKTKDAAQAQIRSTR